MSEPRVATKYLADRVHPNRTSFHRFMGPGGECPCLGLGYVASEDENDPREYYCDCPCGAERARVERA